MHVILGDGGLRHDEQSLLAHVHDEADAVDERDREEVPARLYIVQLTKPLHHHLLSLGANVEHRIGLATRPRV